MNCDLVNQRPSSEVVNVSWRCHYILVTFLFFFFPPSSRCLPQSRSPTHLKFEQADGVVGGRRDAVLNNSPPPADRRASLTPESAFTRRCNSFPSALLMSRMRLLDALLSQWQEQHRQWPDSLTERLQESPPFVTGHRSVCVWVCVRVCQLLWRWEDLLDVILNVF